MATIAPASTSTDTSTLIHASAGELAAMIRERTVTAREVVDAHIERLEAFQPRTRAVAAERYDAARAEAELADERIAAASDTNADTASLASEAPLLGVPCTIKEAFEFEGMPNTSGLVSRVGRTAASDAPTVARLRGAGAIPLAVTNTSELCMWMESDNRVYGRTSSAYDSRRIAGGSSGGEGAAVGSGGSPFGLGADIGGSVRLPAFFNGVFGHKASPGLIPNTGQFPIPPDEVLHLLTPGPLTRRAEDLMLLTRVLAGPDGQDPSCVPSGLGDPSRVNVDGLRVLVVEGDGVMPVSRRIAGGLQRAAGALKTLGADVQTMRIRSLRRAFSLWGAEMTAGGASQMALLLGGDSGVPVTVRRALIDAARRRSPHTLASVMVLTSDLIGSAAPARMGERLRALAEDFRHELSDLIGDGVLLYPPYPWVAPRHNWPMLMPFGFTYTAIFNVAGTPVTQVPVGLDDRGLPLGVQVVGRPGADHVTIAVAQALETALGGWQDPARQAARSS